MSVLDRDPLSPPKVSLKSEVLIGARQIVLMKADSNLASLQASTCQAARLSMQAFLSMKVRSASTQLLRCFQQ